MLSVLGLIAVFIAAYFVYKTAKETNRNVFGWSLLTVAVGVGSQIILPGIIFFIIAAVMAVLGSPIKNVDDLPFGMTLIIGVFGLAASIAGIWLVMRHVSKIPDETTYNMPPSPPTFDGK